MPKADMSKPAVPNPYPPKPTLLEPIGHLRIVHPFDVALAVRGRRRQLKLRQSEVARAAGVGREWLVDLEHGKPSVELGLVLRTLEVLGIEVDVLMLRRPPAWTVPLSAAGGGAPRAPRRDPRRANRGRT